MSNSSYDYAGALAQQGMEPDGSLLIQATPIELAKNCEL